MHETKKKKKITHITYTPSGATARAKQAVDSGQKRYQKPSDRQEEMPDNTVSRQQKKNQQQKQYTLRI